MVILHGSMAKSILALPKMPDVVYEIDPTGVVVEVDINPIQPKYGEPGGGTQVQFPTGVPSNNVKGPYKICP